MRGNDDDTASADDMEYGDMRAPTNSEINKTSYDERES
jgi:hypothetical protein